MDAVRALPSSFGREQESQRDGEMHFAKDEIGYLARWEHWRVTIGFSMLRETTSGIVGEVTIESDLIGRLEWGHLSLASTSARENLAKKLSNSTGPRGPAWAHLLEKACYRVAQEVRKIPPAVQLQPRPKAADAMLMEPILSRGHPTLLYAPPDSGKTIFAMFLGLGASTGEALPGGFKADAPVPVLHLDAEGQHQEDLEAILFGLMRGLGLEDAGVYMFRSLKGRPLAEVLPAIAQDVRRLGHPLLILDSHAYAADDKTTDHWHTRAIGVWTALQRLDATPLVLAHTPADEPHRTGAARRAFGGQFMRAGARLEWELRRAVEDEETGNLTLAAYNTKYNYGRRARPISLQFRFTGTREAHTITAHRHDLSDEPSLFDRASLAYRLQHLLRDGAQDVKALAQATQAKQDTVGRTLRRLKNEGKVIDFPGKDQEKTWGLQA